MARRLAWWLVISLVVPIASTRAQSVDTVALRNAIAQAGGRVIIGVKPARGGALRQGAYAGMPAAQLDAIEQRISRQYPLTVHGRAPLASAIFATIGDSDLVRVLADSNVELIVPDHLGVPVDAISSLAVKRRADAVARRAETTPWGVTTVGAPAAWAAGLTGAGIKVGVIDGGIDYTHPDLNVVGGYDAVTFSTSPSAYNDNIPSCGGHGTHVAGTIGAKNNGSGLLGVAPGVSLYALKVFQDFGGSCLAWESDQIAALNWAATNGVRVVNISIGNASYNQVYQNAITSAIAAGVTVVASAGNGSGGAIVFPGAYVGVIAVGAVDQSNVPASYESVGPQMWVTAPGTNILSTMPGNTTGTKSGTSMAAPHVVGIVALMLQAQSTWTPAQVQQALKLGATDLGAVGFDNITGWGLAKAPTSGSGTIPVVVAVSPTAKSVSISQGAAAPSDNATVTLSGTNASTTAWTATKKQSWNTLTGASGTGSGTIAWSRNATGLAVGTYVDTITVTATGSTPAVLFDTLKITPATVPVTIALTPTVRSVTAQQGAAVAGDNASVALSGTNAWSTNWTVAKKKSWTTLVTTSGMGNGAISWNRSTAGLAVGTYVDTITVSATGVTPAVLFDTLKVTASQVTMAFTPIARSVSVQQGNAAPGDNATLTLNGSNGPSTVWGVAAKKSWTTVLTSTGTGTATVSWTRNTTALAVGTYVDTLTASAGGVTPTVLYDTVKVTAAPVVVAVSPAARSVTITQGNSAPSDNGTVTLSGTNALSTAWSASKTASWVTFTTPSGVGNGTVAWTRNTAALVAGTYVDTVTISVAGSSPAVLFDTLKVNAISVVIALTPASRYASVPQGGSALADVANVTLTGTNAASTVWTATKRAAWNTLTSATGIGNGSLGWSRNAAGLAPGTYVDTITVAAAGVPSVALYDTLAITAVPIVVALNPAARTASVVQGAAAPGDNAAITLTGTNASTTAWTASKKKSWTTVTTSSGTGNGTLAWTRSATGLAVGTYVDTLTVVAGGVAQGVVFDTLKITAAAVPVVIALSPTSRSTSIQVGGAGGSDNATVTLTGTNASSVAWTATKKKSWNTLTTASGTGSGTIAWTRATTALLAGTHVDTITVTAAGIAPVMFFDTVRVTNVAVVVGTSPTSRSTSVQQGGTPAGDNASVWLTGTNAWTVGWTVTRKKSWTTLTSSAGTGNGAFAWTRNATGLAAGTYVDTLTVSAVGGSVATLIDTLKVLPAAVAVSVTPQSRNASVSVGGTAPADSAAVTLTGTFGQTTAWTATKKKSWNTLVASSGTGNGTISWTRNATGLAVGTYVDTLTISAAGIAPAVLFDTLVVAPVQVVASLSPLARSVTVPIGGSAANDNAAVTLTGTLASTTAWTATKTKAWTTLTAATGTGSGTIAWSRSTAALAIGTYVDTITVTAVGVAPVALFDTIKVVPVPVTVAVSPLSRNVAVPQSSIAPSDNATVTLGGTNGWSTAWTATRKKSWTTLTSATGTGNGSIAWTRNVLGLAAGTYVDTITVTAAGIAPAILYDTMRVTPTSVTVAVSPGSRSVTAAQGSAVAGASGSVTLAGSGSTSTVWTATSRKPWTTITAASGIGSGTVSWTRASATLPVGTWVDTLTISVAGAVPATIIDTVKITTPPFVAVFIPVGKSTTIPLGNAAPSGSAGVWLSGTNAWMAQWTVSKKKPWTTLVTLSGSGNQTVLWVRNVTGFPIGTYVDTITVSGAGVAPAVYYDTLKIVVATPPLTGLKTAVTGTHEVVVIAAGLQSATPRDSTNIVADAPEVTDTSMWYASATSSRVSLVTTEGVLSSSKVAWTRAVEGLAAGRYIDTIVVALVDTPEIRAHIVDTLDVISVVLPEPEAAAQELFAPGHLNVDQRAALDQIGNHNGQYDLGDFLAWVDRAGIHLSATIRKQLLTLPTTPPVKPKEPPL